MVMRTCYVNGYGYILLCINWTLNFMLMGENVVNGVSSNEVDCSHSTFPFFRKNSFSKLC